MAQIETTNDFMVGVLGDQFILLRPPIGPMPREKALRLAAFLVALAEIHNSNSADHNSFTEILKAVQST